MKIYKKKHLIFLIFNIMKIKKKKRKKKQKRIIKIINIINKNKIKIIIKIKKSNYNKIKLK